MKLTKSERRKYKLPSKKDLEILARCKKLESMKLSESDEEIVKLIKSSSKTTG